MHLSLLQNLYVCLFLAYLFYCNVITLTPLYAHSILKLKLQSQSINQPINQSTNQHINTSTQVLTIRGYGFLGRGGPLPQLFERDSAALLHACMDRERGRHILGRVHVIRARTRVSEKVMFKKLYLYMVDMCVTIE